MNVLIITILYIGTSTVLARPNSDRNIFNSDNGCIEPFVYIAEKCFWLFRGNESVDRKRAWSECRNADARLARVTDPLTHGELLKWIHGHEFSFMSYWIGLLDSTGNGEFRWDDGTVGVTFTSWSQDQSVNTSNHECVVMSSDIAHNWKAVSCSDRNLFICEKNVEPSGRTLLRSADDLSSFCDRRSLGYHANPNDCRRYILCHSNKMYDFGCTDGEVFNPHRGICTKQGIDVICTPPTTTTSATTIVSTTADEYEYEYDEDEGEYDEDELPDDEDIKEEEFQNYPDHACTNSNYKKLGKKCYKFFLRPVSWNIANQICIGDENGQLVSIKTSWEQKFLVKGLRGLASDVGVYDFWIGLNDLKTSDTYVWSDKEELSERDYQNWSRTARKRHKELKKCVEMRLLSKGKWEDNMCFSKNGYICEKAAVNPFEIPKVVTGKSISGVSSEWTSPSAYCGTSRRPDIPQAVIGGVRADMAEHPWQASLRSWGEHRCGGSLIGRCWVLTAAHCVDHRATGRTKLPTLVVLGDYDTSLPEGTELFLPILERIIHPNWTAIPVPTHDIALVKLGKCVDDLNPICLPGKTYEGFLPGHNCKVAGWGTMDNTRSDYPDHLQEAELPLLRQEVCRSKYIIKRVSAIKEGMICAGRLDGGTDTCQGDSGGPLACKKLKTDEGAIQWGIVSWGFGCARKDRPGVYTKVSKYMEWIRNHTKIDF